MDYKKLNNYIGWLVFFFACWVYFSTLEPTTSLWDCGEYITTAYKLEVGHPPGAPLFMMLGRLFSMFASPENAAYMVNGMSALSSAFTILFLFWSITLLAKKIVTNPEVKLFGGSPAEKGQKFELTDGYKWAILGSGLIGAVAYTFTDSFWFSAVEGEVYAMSSFFTAIVFWAILKWDDEVQMKENHPDDETLKAKNENRWIILIFFMIGLSIGVHLLNLLCIPVIAYVIYFRKYKETTIGGFLLTGVIGVGALGLIQAVIIPKTVQIAGYLERIFVNDMGMPFNTGTVFFFILLMAVIVGLLILSRKTNNSILNTITWSATMIFIGYSCFAMIVIRSNANTPLDENDPENLVSLQAYLQREQYGDWPILYGQYFTADYKKDRKQWKDRSDVYLRRFVVVNKAGDDTKGFKYEDEAKAYAAQIGGSIEEKYFKTFDGTNQKPTYDPKHCTFFPRMYSNDPNHISRYQAWSGHKGSKPPTMGENLAYFGAYQVGWMYWRYFMWNFSGRQSDEQSSMTNSRDGNWISGLNFIDSHHIGDQTHAPSVITSNPSYNKFYMLPLLLGLIGFIFTMNKATKTWWTILLLFLLTGFAIIIYLNQKPLEPRERDYAYAASFYAFSIYIGMAVLALYDAYKSMTWTELGKVYGTMAGIGIVFFVVDKTAGISLLYMAAIAAALHALFIGMRNAVPKEQTSGILATLLLLPAPIIMGVQGWDDHDRSDRYTAQALAENYLNSCDEQGIIYTNGDNDTFPLWYLQEVEEKKTSVRVCNLSLLNTDWYTEQMTRKAYESEPLPIKFTEEQYRQNGSLDYLYILGTNEGTMQEELMDDKWRKAIDIKIAANPEEFKAGFKTAVQNLGVILQGTNFPEAQPEVWAAMPTFDSTNTYYQFRNLVFHLTGEKLNPETGVNKYGMNGEQLQAAFNTLITFNDSFDSMPLADALNFLRNDAYKESNGLFIMPSRNVTVPVDKDKVVANGIVEERFKDRIVDELDWRIAKQTIFKADLMILEMVANFNWDRPIYFASSASPSTYLGLDKYFFAEGLVYKLVPIEAKKNRNPNSLGEVNKEKMYDNLVNKFKWGNMEKEDVLVDYYTRRLTNNYRVQFSVLAGAYAEAIEEAQKKISVLDQIATTDAPDDQIIKTPVGDFVKGEVAIEKAKAQQLIDEYSVKVIEVLDKSFEVMPEYNVPYGRVMPSYISDYYVAGADEKAEMYSDRMLELYREDIDYTLNVEPQFSNLMINDTYDALRGIFSIWQSAQMHSENTDFQMRATQALVDAKDDLKTYIPKMKKEASKSQKALIGQTLEGFIGQVDMMMSMEL